ncbi:UPF0692 protein CG33108 [Hermetia illucens]|uniref:UPF0692 protein CG33108 n=1 Tax=Hermetia illucens TaxID=343691 RepID=UPI0018CC59E7|nr:UPF0692 protein CG33108 [Hermetia illucens]
MSLPTPVSNSAPPPPEPNFHVVTSAPLTPAQQIALSECTWAAGHPDIQMACYLGRICTNAPPKCCRYKAVPSIIQAGPTCGLTALSMLLNGQPSPEEILNLAKERHFTHIGEMFSAHNFFELVREVLGRHSAITVQCHLYQGRLNCAKVKERLTCGACIFVPYDPDFNHGPCLKLGHKAHWALIIGYMIDADDEFYVLARHGKTKNIAVWPLKALSASNSNLIEFAQPKGYPDTDFLVPDGGIGGELGLKNRSIIVEGLPTEDVVII